MFSHKFARNSKRIVFGEPTEKQRDIWDLEKKAQRAAFEAAKVVVPCEEVDPAARWVLVDAGLGPDRRVFGCPHRTGHGIGLDGREWIHLVRGNKTLRAPGMCFSNEPMTVIPGNRHNCLDTNKSRVKFEDEPDREFKILDLRSEISDLRKLW